MQKHDGPVTEGFSGYEKSAEDPNGVPASGNSLDSYYLDDHALKASAEQLEIFYRFDRGEISQDEAYTLLDMLAASSDS